MVNKRVRGLFSGPSTRSVSQELFGIPLGSTPVPLKQSPSQFASESETQRGFQLFSPGVPMTLKKGGSFLLKSWLVMDPCLLRVRVGDSR